MKTPGKPFVIVMLAALIITPLGNCFRQHQTNAQAQGLSVVPDQPPFITVASASGLSCRTATREEARVISRQDKIELHAISPSQPSFSGLKITLRSTAQLDQFPEAKEAFLRAAATWENLIRTPITIVIDVDFGSTFFGQAFPPNVLGGTSAQILAGGGLYNLVRSDLIYGASSVKESLLYSQLPTDNITTDIGVTNIMASPSAGLRALGLINPVADPVGELPSFGPPPRIGFNSAFAFDFEPSDGIDNDKVDFDGIAVHEIGHVLGFASDVGLSELIPGFPAVPTVWDLFRFRPYVNLASFGSAERVLSSGGQQTFFAISPALELSTGRPDGSGGDGFQASHWKAVVINPFQPPIGIMVPAFGFGQRHVITNNDLRAIDAIGYTIR